MAPDQETAQQTAARLERTIFAAHRVKLSGGDATAYLAAHCSPRDLDLITALWGYGVATGRIRLAPGRAAPPEEPS